MRMLASIKKMLATVTDEEKAEESFVDHLLEDMHHLVAAVERLECDRDLAEMRLAKVTDPTNEQLAAAAALDRAAAVEPELPRYMTEDMEDWFRRGADAKRAAILKLKEQT